MERFRRLRREKVLSRLLAEEFRRNVVLGHVMFQQKTRRPFSTSACDRAAAVPGLTGGAWQEYHRLLLLYNKALEDLEWFRDWYAGDIERQTREKARELDQKWENVEALFRQIFAFLGRARTVEGMNRLSGRDHAF
jgi:hypothetical protein